MKYKQEIAELKEEYYWRHGRVDALSVEIVKVIIKQLKALKAKIEHKKAFWESEGKEYSEPLADCKEAIEEIDEVLG